MYQIIERVNKYMKQVHNYKLESTGLSAAALILFCISINSYTRSIGSYAHVVERTSITFREKSIEPIGPSP